jgi:hypothetical protein
MCSIAVIVAVTTDGRKARLLFSIFFLTENYVAVYNDIHAERCS